MATCIPYSMSILRQLLKLILIVPFGIGYIYQIDKED